MGIKASCPGPGTLGGTSTKKTRLTKRLNGTEDQSSHRGRGVTVLVVAADTSESPNVELPGVFVFLVLVEILGERTSGCEHLSGVWERGVNRRPSGKRSCSGPLGGFSALSAAPPGVWSYSSSVCFHVNQTAH